MSERALRPPAVHAPALVRDSLRAQVADAVRAALVAGQMSPGEVYSAPQFAERFGVSVTPVREALLELVRDGLLVAVRNRARVAAWDPEGWASGRAAADRASLGTRGRLPA